MRIKIKGEITAERLAEALHAAAEKYEAVRPGPRWPVQIPPSVATPNSPRQGQWNYDGSVLMASRLAASLSL